jgi:hypothetical protein
MMFRLFCAMIALLSVQPVTAQESANRKCSDDAGQNRCGEMAMAKTRDKYGLEDATMQAAQGTYVRRAMIVDGYGRDVLAVSFAREKGKEPYVEIRGAKVEGSKEPRFIRMPISETDWNRTNVNSQFFDRDFAPKATKADEIEICLHSWMVSVEFANPARFSSNTSPADPLKPVFRSKTQSSCAGGLAVQYGFQLVDLAHEMIPVCKSISVETQRNKAMLLSTCLSLSGDRAAAGHGVTLFNELRKADDSYPKDPVETQKKLARLIALADSNSPHNRLKTGRQRLTENRRQEMVALLSEGNIYFSAFTGIDADHVIIEGSQTQASSDPNLDKRSSRKITISASRQANEFRIHDIQVSAFN